MMIMPRLLCVHDGCARWACVRATVPHPRPYLVQLAGNLTPTPPPACPT
jgi:hypothetical protein